jgi:hypothetical protein
VSTTPDEAQWAAELLQSLRWRADMLVEPDDRPGEQWWLTPGGWTEVVGLMACCQKDYPCPHHDGQPIEDHRLIWSTGFGWWACTCGRLSCECEDD